MKPKRETFGKNERLCSKKVIAELFENGNHFFCNPFYVLWMNSTDIPIPAQVAFSVPKKKFKHAVSRNLIRRRIREAYRKNKCDLYDFLISINKKIVFILIYKEDTIMDYMQIEKSIKELIEMFIHILDKSQNKC
jgi:ribonuclease P protein component